MRGRGKEKRKEGESGRETKEREGKERYPVRE